MKTTKTTRIVLVVTAVLTAFTLAACVHRGKEEPQPKPKEAIPYQPPPTPLEVMEGPYPEYKVGDIVEERIAPVTGARVYEQMEKVIRYDTSLLLSPVIVEYKGKKTKLEEDSALIDISPDGRYVLYIRTNTRGYAATFIYDVVIGKTQQLTTYDDPNQGPDFVPYPEPSETEIKWSGNKISYEALDKTWTLTFKKE